ncbi:MAG: hypothetical protein MUF53_11465 [Gemmatimonadaceae bacterium]|nr:hypothetical protein [Gemmatimonadaceae bacterium]
MALTRRHFGFWLGIAAATSADAQQPDSSDRFVIGARSTLLVGALPLSRLGAPLRDLAAGDDPLPHASSLFFQWRRGPRWRIGLETLVGNSYSEATTSVLFQGAGLSVEYHVGGRTFAVLGAQAGGMIGSATEPTSAVGSPSSALRSGVHYKGSGLFAAPLLGVGRRFGRYELALIARRAWHGAGTRGMAAFDGTYVGLTLARRL